MQNIWALTLSFEPLGIGLFSSLIYKGPCKKVISIWFRTISLRWGYYADVANTFHAGHFKRPSYTKKHKKIWNLMRRQFTVLAISNYTFQAVASAYCCVQASGSFSKCNQKKLWQRAGNYSLPWRWSYSHSDQCFPSVQNTHAFPEQRLLAAVRSWSVHTAPRCIATDRCKSKSIDAFSCTPPSWCHTVQKDENGEWNITFLLLPEGKAWWECHAGSAAVMGWAGEGFDEGGRAGWKDEWQMKGPADKRLAQWMLVFTVMLCEVTNFR